MYFYMKVPSSNPVRFFKSVRIIQHVVLPVVVPVVVVSEIAQVVVPVMVFPKKARMVVPVVVPVNASIVLGSLYASPLFYNVVMLFLSKMHSNPIPGGVCSNGHICSGKHTTIESNISAPRLATEVTCNRSVNKCNTVRFNLSQFSASVHTHDDKVQVSQALSQCYSRKYFDLGLRSNCVCYWQ